jgi:hypothetical protein
MNRLKSFILMRPQVNTAPARKLKPKPDLMQWIQRLPPDRRIDFMRRHHLAN